MEPFHKKTVLVTGATGFLGEYLTQRLTKRYRVLALGRNRRKESDWRNRAPYSARGISPGGKAAPGTSRAWTM